VLYFGQVAHQGEVYAGEQEAIVAQPVWERVQTQLVKGQEKSGVAAEPAQLKKTLPPSAATPPTERVPRITRLLALALKFEELIRSGAVSNYAVLARVGQVSPSRISQMASLLSLAPDIQEGRYSIPASRRGEAAANFGAVASQADRDTSVEPAA